MHRAGSGGLLHEDEYDDRADADAGVATADAVDESVETQTGVRSRRPPPRSRAGFVLVGGESSRMGRDKALMPFGERCLATHVAEQVAAAAGRVILVGAPKKYGHLGYPVLPDLYTGLGPIGAIATALRASGAEWNLVVACDMPSITTDFLLELLGAAQFGLDCVVPMTPDDRLHPLCAVYQRRAARGIDRAIQQGVRSIREALPFIKSRYLKIEHPEWVRNLNTPSDWAEMRDADTPDAGH